MIYIHKNKRKLFLVFGFIGLCFFAIGDVFLQNFKNEGETILYMIKPTIVEQPMWQLYFTLITGMLAIPLMCLGLSAMDSHLKDMLNNENTKMYVCFKTGAVIGILTFFAAHSVCAVLMMSVKNALECGISPEVIDSTYKMPFVLSFAVTNIWVTVSEIMLSVAFIYFVCKKIIDVPKIMVVMNTIGAFIIFKLVGYILTAITGNEIFNLLSELGASLGVGFMFLAVLMAVSGR
ncbi:MAG: hypothetical protein IJ053_00935 [Lachnospiraceae bacterium]|nr:hypothetical protein [Lachnospiraceae bacterium]